jgi:putative ABC transport system permease protein
MGLTERSRLLAMLRAIGAQRWQVAVAVVIEGLLLAAIGGAVGVPLGLLWLELLVARFGNVLTAGAVVSVGGIAFAAGGVVLASLGASLLPAAIASRLKPLEAMTVTARAPARWTPWISAAVGLLVIGIDVLLVFSPLVPRQWKLHAHVAVGLPTLMIGLFLIAPLIVTAVERVAGPPLAWALRLNRPLARQQLAHGVWRAAGTAAALMVGLVALVVIHTHGNNVLNAWRLPTRFPDLLVFAAFGLDEQGVEKLRNVSGIEGDQVMPIAVTTPELGMNIFGLAGLAQAPNATIFMGIDPDQAFGTAEEDRGMFEADFIEGDAVTARPLLKQGRHVIVSEEYRQLKGIGVGDTIKLGSPRRGQYEYTVAGVVRAPGVDLIIRMFDIEREFEQWTAASVIGSLERAREDFGHDRYHLFAVNLAPGVEKQALERRLKARLATWGLLTADARAIKAFVEHHVREMLALMSAIAFAAIAVAALGVVNTIMASIRVRQWQFGVLRSIGLTRGQLLRFVLLEAGLLGLAASVLGVAGGLLIAFNAGGLAERIIGVAIPYAPAWPAVFIGVGITVAVALFAGLIPAVRTAFARPLHMLQSGRGA